MRRGIIWKDKIEAQPESSSTRRNQDSPLIEDYKSIRKHKTCYGYFKEFTDNTSLHGLKYLGEDRPIFEKIWWIIMFTLGIIACGYLIMKIWNKWDQNPVIVSFAESSTPIWQVPFPAVTICSETKSKQSVYNFTNMYHRVKNQENLTEEEMKDYEAASLLCDKHLLVTGSNYTDYSTIDFFKKVSPTLLEMMMNCKWKNKQIKCNEIFTPVITDDGVCYTFNMLTSKEILNDETLHEGYHGVEHDISSEGWTLDGGYANHVPLETYPRRGTGSGVDAGLTILLRALNSDLDYLCRGPVLGFKVLVHTSAEIPRVGTQYFRVPISQEVIAAVKPNMMTTSNGLKNYDPKRRQCFFPSERKLKYFKIYTQSNCEIECLSNYTKLLCGCVSFAMPRDNDTLICSSGRIRCLIDAADDLLTREIRKGLSDNSTDDKYPQWKDMKEEMNKLAGQCDCMPACTSINYDPEISQADFDWESLFVAFRINITRYTDLKLARLVLFFKESQFITSRRSELYGQTDFLANCGGLLGLCLGFSVLSLVEIIYFVTLRAFCNLKHKYSKRKSHKHNNLVNVDSPDIQETKSVI